MIPSNWKNRDKRLLKKRSGKLSKRVMTEGSNSKANSKTISREQKRKLKEDDELYY